MEKGLKRKKESGDPDEPDEEQAGPSSAQQVTVSFKNTDERWKKDPVLSYKALLARRAEEPWTEYSWHEQNSTFSEVGYVFIHLKKYIFSTHEKSDK